MTDKKRHVFILKGVVVKKCLHQHIRPLNMCKNIKIPGFGDCNNCKYDPQNNKKCKGYQEIDITIRIINIK